jgi:hypothetical protein
VTLDRIQYKDLPTGANFSLNLQDGQGYVYEKRADDTCFTLGFGSPGGIVNRNVPLADPSEELKLTEYIWVFWDPFITLVGALRNHESQ